ncbi:hypothetical protein MKEN_00498700 [Mycena kentingensis (nom. inval.)]|nr:hypothetical protein MKEN_00498700 [Mycena kentingensis (nom. inval.)]
MSTQDLPILPPELEREIFELCALSRPVLVPKLILVAWRVKQWIEPLLYRTIILSQTKSLDGYPRFTPDVLLPALKTKPRLFRDSVRHILLHAVSESVIQAVLSVCTRVENLWAPLASDVLVSLATPDSSRIIATRPLKHLYTNFMPLLPRLGSTHPLFAQLTHLEVIGIPPRRELGAWADAIARLPQLTHLAFNEDALMPICASLLGVCRLQVLVSLIGDTTRVGHDDPRVDDARFVVLFSPWFEDWQMGVHVGKDYWTRAESIVVERFRQQQLSN